MSKLVIEENSLKDFIPTIDSLSLSDIGTYILFDEINAESIKGVSEFIIKANYVYNKGDTVTLMINSPGGDVYDGFGIIDLMDCSRVDVQTTAVGIVASMGSLIFTAGTQGKRVMSRNSYMMIHQFSQYMEGKYHDLIAHRNHEDHLNNKFIEHFVNRSKLSEKRVKDLILNAKDVYIEPKQAKEWGLCDIIQNPWE